VAVSIEQETTNMTVEERLMAALLGHAPLAALVATRVYMDRADVEAPAPFVVLSRAETAPEQTLCDVIDNPDVVFDAHVWAAKRREAEQVATEVKAAVRAAGGHVAGHEAGYSDEVELHAAILKLVVD
jgi:hypothetical protein